MQGLGSLARGAMQGYAFVDGIERQDKYDKQREDQNADIKKIRGYQLSDLERSENSAKEIEQIRKAGIKSQPIPDQTGFETPGLAPLSNSPAQPSMPGLSQSTNDPSDDLIDSYHASQRKAVELGRPDIALEYFQKGMPIREAKRESSFDQARVKYIAKNDPSVFIQPFNRYLNNGINITKIDKVDGGVDEKGTAKDPSFTITGTQDNGSAYTRSLSRDQFEQMISQSRNPRLMAALEAKRAEQLQKSEEEIRQIRAKERFQKVGSGETLVDTQGGGTYTGPTTEKIGIHNIPQGEGMPNRAVIFGDRTGIKGDVSGAGPDDSAFKPKPLAEMHSKIPSLVLRNFGANDMNGLDPKSQEKAMAQQDIATQLATANYGTAVWKNAGEATYATLADKIQKGALVEKTGETADGRKAYFVEYQGQKYLTRPMTSTGSRAESPQQTPAELSGYGKKVLASSGLKEPITMAPRESRSIERLQDDLRSLQDEISKTKSPESKAALEDERRLVLKAIEQKNALTVGLQPRPIAESPRPVTPDLKDYVSGPLRSRPSGLQPRPVTPDLKG